MADHPPDRELQARITALEMELSQKDTLLNQGFEAFTQAAEKLQLSHKKLQQTIAELNLKLEAKNQELEQNLAEKERVQTYLSNILSSLPIGVVVTDMQAQVTYLNRAGAHMLGRTNEAAQGLSVNDLLGHPLLVATANDQPPQLVLSDEALPYGKGSEQLQLQLSASIMKDEQGQAHGFIFNVQDVTTLKKLEAHAQRRNRFTAMGEMAANIAHEIRNPLGSIELFATLVKKGLNEGDDRLTYMNHITSSVASMNHIISNLLAYTKPRPVTRKRVDLHALLTEGVEFSAVMAAHNNIEVETQLEATASHIQADAEQLKQVFTNLFINAIQAMPEGGKLTLQTRDVTVRDPKLLARLNQNRPTRPATRFVELVFQDTGQGIPKDIQRQIFDPFFTTKSQGTGLGLAIVHNIIESHEGNIEVYSQPGLGAQFVLTFPLAED